MRLIDADTLQGLFNEVSTSLLCKKELEKEVAHMVRAFLMTTEMIQDAPTVDAVPVVRCKDCKFYNNHAMRDVVFDDDACHWNADEQPDSDDFCSAGERRSE